MVMTETTQTQTQAPSTMGKKVVEFSIEECMIKSYNMVRQGKNGCSVQVTLPRLLLEKVARKKGFSVLDEFLDQYFAVAYWGGGDEVLYRFEKKSSKGIIAAPENQS